MIHLQETLNNNFNIKNMLECDRPREKMLTKGVKSLSDAELLAIIIRTGNKKYNAIELSNQIFKEKLINIRDLYDISIEELCTIDGIGLTPDIEQQLPENFEEDNSKENDKQLQSAIDFLVAN